MVELARVFEDLVRVEMALWGSIDEILRVELGITLGRFEAMREISRLDQCRASDIARSMGITEGGTSKMVARIKAAGHCRRMPDPIDRRASMITLTDSGAEMLVKAQEVFDRELRKRIAVTLDTQTLNGLATALSTLRSANAAQGQGEDQGKLAGIS